ncbi:hypothetical protein ACIQXV_07175 [Neobacillus sp. NPDC097160]|uniref:hypothetical protein n=1 Tax=Neobacillus sp. NPDC097160 TaxID=3364298 RepID=UPI0038049242
MKKWKILLTVFVLILAAGGGTLYFFLNIKEYKTADKKVKEIVQGDYTIKLPGEEDTDNPSKSNANGQVAGSTESGLIAVNNSGETDGSEAGRDTTGGNAGTSAQQSNNQTNSSTSESSKPSAASIIKRYEPSFRDLESQADGKLNSLLSYAINEYQTKKANKEDVSYFYFYSKYTSAAKTLESSTDASFNYIYNALVNELQQAGFSSSEAMPIKDHYTSLKKQRRSALMNKAMANS